MHKEDFTRVYHSAAHARKSNMYWIMFSGELRREHEVYEKRRPTEQRGGQRKIRSVKCRKSGTSNFLFGNNFNLTEKVTRLA